jgi:hypothetical protein
MDDTVGPNPDDWTPEMRFIVGAIGKALDGKEPCFSLISEARTASAHCLPDHTVEVGRIRLGQEINPHSEYWIAVDGDRIKAIWTVEADALHKVLKGQIPH